MKIYPNRPCLILGLLLLFNGVLQASALHLIILADTESHTGEIALVELNHVRREFARVSELTKMELKAQIFNGLVNRSSVLAALEQLQPEKEDCIVFYYIGHGYRTSIKQTPWPLLYLTKEKSNLDLQDVIDQVISKKPRFGLIVADCCNNVMDGIVTFELTPLMTLGRDPVRGYLELFAKSTGIVIVSAAQPGDYAYCGDQGHCYSQAFWQVISNEVLHPVPQWRHVLDETATVIRSVQVPYDEILTYTENH